ncbi:MAG: hypothetical protein ACRDG7_07175 [Candidatus Limnocylindria bacterium]
MVSKTVLVDGISMRWEEHGDGFPVVLVHGIPTSPALWRHVIPMIDGQALAWEMVGYGHSIPKVGVAISPSAAKPIICSPGSRSSASTG